MRHISIAGLAAVLGLASPISAAELSGGFVAGLKDGAAFIQLVESAGGQLTGRFEQVVVDKDGKFVETTASLTGVADGGTVVLTLRPEKLLSGGVTISGTFDGQVLHIRGGAGQAAFEMNLTRGDEPAFNLKLQGLYAQSEHIRQESADVAEAKKSEERLKGLKALTTKIEGFGPYAERMLAGLVKAEAQLPEISQKMRKALAKEQAIRGDDFDAQIARGDLVRYIEDGSIASEDVYRSVMGAQGEYQSITMSISQVGAQYRLMCSDLGGPTAILAENLDVDAWKVACEAFTASARTYDANVARLALAFNSLSEVWSDHATAIAQISETARSAQ